MNNAKPPTLHDQYWALSFRPLIRRDGSVGMVGISNMGPGAVEPEMYPNLLMAAPALYQQLYIVNEILHQMQNGAMPSDADIATLIDECEKAIVFAQKGYLMPKVDMSQFGKK